MCGYGVGRSPEGVDWQCTFLRITSIPGGNLSLLVSVTCQIPNRPHQFFPFFFPSLICGWIVNNLDNKCLLNSWYEPLRIELTRKFTISNWLTKNGVVFGRGRRKTLLCGYGVGRSPEGVD
jgi:hypothetical protein